MLCIHGLRLMRHHWVGDNCRWCQVDWKRTAIYDKAIFWVGTPRAKAQAGVKRTAHNDQQTAVSKALNLRTGLHSIMHVLVHIGLTYSLEA